MARSEPGLSRSRRTLGALLGCALGLASALGLAACGARSGLETPDAAPPPPSDASYFAVFPCRWSLGVPFELGRDGVFSELIGAVHPYRNLLVVGEVGGRAAMLTTDQRPVEVLPVPPPGAALFTGREGWLELRLRAVECELGLSDEAFSTFRLHRVAGGFECRAWQTELGTVEIATGGADPPALTSFTLSADAAEVGPPLQISAPALPDAVVRDTAGRTVLAWSTDAGVVVQRILSSEEVDEVALAGRGRVSLALDRVTDAVVLLLAAGAEAHLYRVPFEGPLALEEILPRDRFPAPPVGRVVTNETEAIVPLADGTMIAVPHGTRRMRLFVSEPVAPAVERMEVVLRPGTSAGGLLHVREEGGERVLAYHPLVCNR